MTPEGRISPWDLGIWKDEHIEHAGAHRALHSRAGSGSRHAAGPRRPKGKHAEAVGRSGGIPESEGGWKPVAPSALPTVRITRIPRPSTRPASAES